MALALLSSVLLDQAKNDFRRSEQLAQRGFIAPAKLDTDRLSSLGVQREVEAAAAERRIAVHDLEQPRAALGATREPPAGPGQRGFTVRAPSAGRVRSVEPAAFTKVSALEVEEQRACAC